MKIKVYKTIVATALVSTAYGVNDGSLAPPPALDNPNEVEVEYTLLKPTDKTSEKVAEDERNPYTNFNDKAVEQAKTNSNEENAIRDRLEKLRVVGSTRGDDGKLRVMLGDMVLEAGELVPQLLPDQTINLKVVSIEPDRIELQWIEQKSSGLPPRGLTIPVDLRPYVRFVLYGQLKEENSDKINSDEEKEVSLGRFFPETKSTDPAGNVGSVNPADAQPASTPPQSQNERNQAISLLKPDPAHQEEPPQPPQPSPPAVSRP